MGACRDVQVGFRENVVIPVMQGVTAWRQACREYRELVHREVRRPMEQWVEETQRVCDSWPWPLNWFCSLVVVLVRVVVWVVEVVAEWVVSLLCEVVAVIVEIVVRLVAAVVEFVASFFVCLFTGDIGGWLYCFYDLWTNILDVVELVFDLVGTIIDAVIGIVEATGVLVEAIIVWYVSIIPWVGTAIGAFFAGLYRWAFRVIRRALEIVRDVIHHLQDVIFGVLRLDFCRALGGVVGILTDIGQVVILYFNFCLGWMAGIRDGLSAGNLKAPFATDNLADIVDSRLTSAFAGDPAGLARARTRARLYARPPALPLMLQPRRFYLSSRSTAVDLAALHNAGTLNLYTAVGGPNGCDGRGVFKRPYWEVVYAGTEMAVSRRDIDHFLGGGATAAPEFRVYGIRHSHFERYLTIARRKGREVGVEFDWERIGEYQVAAMDEIPVAEAAHDTLMMRMGRVGGGGDDLCVIPALGVHDYDNDHLSGLTSWYRPPAEPLPSGVSFRERTPEFAFQWALVHELGHYLGLNHAGHPGLEHIMYTTDPSLPPVTGGTVAEYVALGGEPRFTLDDARRVWDWLTANALACVRGP